MLLERGDVKKLAQLLAQKVGAKPEEWSATIQRAAKSRSPEVSLPCSGSYGVLPTGTAARALNFMHFAVNGTPRNPEDSEKPSETPQTEEGRCEPLWFHQASCSSLSNYDLCNCSPQVIPGFDCVDGQTFGVLSPCLGPQYHGCELYKCTGAFICPPTFSCSRVYYQTDADCPTGLSFNCSRFDCSAEGDNDFGCTDGEHTCGRSGGFNCKSPESFFNCRGEYVCKPSLAPFACQTLRYSCTEQHQCATYVGFSCASIHDCKVSIWCTGIVFTCDDTTGSFRCGGGPISCGEDFCTSVIQCERNNPGVPVFECSGFSCEAQFNP